jgi:two-component system, OmpR family, sensor kinase
MRLRPRLTLLVAAVVMLSIAIAFAAVYRATSNGLGARTDADLGDDLAALQAALERRDGDLVARARASVSESPFRATARLIVVAVPGAAPVSNLSALFSPSAEFHGEHRPHVSDLLDAPEGFTQQHIPMVGLIRVLARETLVDGEPVRLVVGTPVQPTDRAKDVVGRGFLLAGLLAVAAALAGGAFVAGRVVAPLRRMAAVAAQVDEGDLGRRMGDVGHRDEVAQLARSFDTMLDRLEDAFDRQGAFVADASHELRTPLTVIRGQLELLRMQDDPRAEDVRRVEAMVRREVDRMGRLVEDMLLLTSVGQSEFLRRQPIDLAELLGEVLDGLRHTADRRFELSAVPPVVLDADPDRLAQALRNVLCNAIAHTDDGGLVRLTAEEAGDRLRVVVDDAGPGTPSAGRRSVFDRFHRLQAGGRAGGAGLGLSIVQAIVTAHGGAAWADASPEGGTRLVLELPTPERTLTGRSCTPQRTAAG